jgi:hypothetical protein
MIPISARRDALNAIAFSGLAVYLVLACVSFFTFVQPSLNGENGWRVYADSDVYMNIADYIRSQEEGVAAVELMSFARNLLLPAYVALSLKTAVNIFAFNVLVFFGCLGLLARTFSSFKWYIFLPIILASPTTYEALLTLNKEIFVFLCVVVIARWFKTRSTMLMILLVSLSMVLRWEQAFAILCFLILLKMKVSPKRAAVMLIVGISAAYPFAMASVDVGVDPKVISTSVLFAQINVLQSYGLYFALLVPKLMIALLSQVVQFWIPFIDKARLHDLPTGLFVLVDQICMCFVVLASWRQSLWVKESPVVYFVLVYCLITLAAPENATRYLYMPFVLMAVVLSSPELQSLRIPMRTESLTKVRSAYVPSGTVKPSLKSGEL